MASNQRKFYVVWEGYAPGIYDSWEECKIQVDGYPGAKYKAFDNQEAATRAFRGTYEEQTELIKAIASHRSVKVNYEAIPEIRLNAISVDGACSGN
ncbi:MAG: RNase H1/viroplasmin domain-containing protein, partial [Muribaculaceae bacterium]|nr:RNase H1/viroplasmin domain-containing protein [Muribaculaceae bacterium]